MQENDLFAEAANQLFQGECTPKLVRAIENGASHQALWNQLENAGFPDALVPESAGGAGLELAQVYGVWALCGAYVLPVPLAETMIARGLLSLAGQPYPDGSIALAEGHMDANGHLRCTNVSLGKVADSVLVEHNEGLSLMPVSQASTTSAAFVLDNCMTWNKVSRCAISLPQGITLRLLQACQTAAQLSGAMHSVCQRTLQYANERQQFGRPIGKFQAIQHQLAVMSEHVFAARMAARLGCASSSIWPDRQRVAVAKARCSQAALSVAEAGHAIHGAIGFTAEFDLQLLTRRLHAWRLTAGSESYWHSIAGEALLSHTGSTLDFLRHATDVAV